MSGRWKIKNQFIDLEAQVGSDDEDLSDAEDGGRVASFIDDTLQDKPRSSSTSAPGFSEAPVDFSASTRPNRLGTLVGRIEDKYLNDPKEPVADDLQVDELDRRGWLWLRGQDWALWRVKCTPSQEYFILYELMLKHETLSDELRAVFFNPRDVGYIYLEAQFSKVGISSLREVLKGFSDIRMSTLVVVPERDLQRCLTIPDLDNQVFARGQWIQIKRGLYRGDVGLVVDDYRYDDSTTGVKVLVVPRLEFSNEDGPPTSSSSKRKRLPSRPSPQLFNPSRCIQDQLFCREKHVYSYKSWRFEYGLQLKTYNKLTLSPAREIPAAICHLFMESKEKAANENALIEMSSMPVPSFWRFETGDHIIVYSPTGAKFGTIVSLTENYNTLLPQCEVDVEEEGSQLVSIRDLQKNIILGEFIEVLAGVHAGKKGFVVAKTDALLGICAGSRTNGLDFRVHVNSVKLTTPDFSNTEVPWVDVEVKIQSGPFTGSIGIVKDVRISSARSLLITVRLTNGLECIVGYRAVRELATHRLLADHQPLKPHQQQFNVEVPWRDVEVVIQSGRFVGCSGFIKNVRVDFRGALLISFWVARYQCSIEIDHSAVREKQSNLPLMTFRPLEGNEVLEYSFSSSLELMRTGPVPWVGMLVDFVQGEYKGQHGAVKDVNRYQINPKYPSKKSGLDITVERYVFTPNPASKVVKVDYDMLKYHKTGYRLCDVFMPTARQSFYMPNQNYENKLNNFSSASVLMPQADTGAGSSTPFSNASERATIFTGVWSPSCPTPGPASSPAGGTYNTPGYHTPGYETPVLNIHPPVPRTPASPSPSRPSRPSPVPSPLAHWILHPKLVGIPIKVDIKGGELDTSNKADGIYVESVVGINGITVLHRHSRNKTIEVPYDSIVSFRRRPLPAREKGLMVVTKNHPEFIGKLVRRIHHFYNQEKTEDNHMLMLITVDRSGPRETKGWDFPEVHPNDVEYVKETSEERNYATQLLQPLREDLSYSGVLVRRDGQL